MITTREELNAHYRRTPILLTIVCFREGPHIIAHALERDLCTYGATITDAVEALGGMIAAQDRIEAENPAQGPCPPSPEALFEGARRHLAEQRGT